MGKINWGRVVAGGLLAGVVLNVFDYVLNGVILAADWNAALQALGKGAMDMSMVKWFILCDFLVGIWVVWLYAAIRPRYGAGAKTAVWAGLGTWALWGFIHAVGEAPIGIFPSNLYYTNVAVALVMLPLAAVAGAWPYKE